jgi:AcrR family transcriptional regulator
MARNGGRPTSGAQAEKSKPATGWLPDLGEATAFNSAGEPGEMAIGVPASKRALRSQGRETMRKLLDAAMVAFDRRGFHATRVNDVVDIANMSHGTFYLYFSNMSDLIRALTIEVATDASELHRALDEAGTSLDAQNRDDLRQWIDAYSKLWVRYAPLFRSWTELAAADDAMGKRIRRTLGTMRDAMAAQISTAGTAGDLNPEVAGTAVLAMLDRFHFFRDLMGEPIDSEALDTLTTMIHRGLFAGSD